MSWPHGHTLICRRHGSLSCGEVPRRKIHRLTSVCVGLWLTNSSGSPFTIHSSRNHTSHNYIPENASIILMTAGPRIATNSDGKINRISGNNSLMGTLAAFSSARWKRCVRKVSE